MPVNVHTKKPAPAKGRDGFPAVPPFLTALRGPLVRPTESNVSIGSPGNAGAAAQTTGSGRCQVSGIKCQVSGVGCKLSHFHTFSPAHFHHSVPLSGSGGNFRRILPGAGSSLCPAPPCRFPPAYFSPSQPLGVFMQLWGNYRQKCECVKDESARLQGNCILCLDK